MKISDACQDYLDFCRHHKQLSSHSLRAYLIDLGEFQHFAEATLPIIDCDKHLLRGYARHLFGECNLKEASVKRRIACLKALFRWLETEELLEINPFHKAAIKIKLPARLPRSLGKEEVRKLLHAPLSGLGFHKREDCRGEALRAAARSHDAHLQFTALASVELLIATGVRVGELVKIQLQEVNLEEGIVYIQGKGDRERAATARGGSLLFIHVGIDLIAVAYQRDLPGRMADGLLSPQPRGDGNRGILHLPQPFLCFLISDSASISRPRARKQQFHLCCHL